MSEKKADLGQMDIDWEPQEHSEDMRTTQVEAFTTIKENGLLSQLRFIVYEAIYMLQGETRGVTSGELDRYISERQGGWTRSASPRLSELVALGVIKEAGQRKCSVSGQTVIEYRSTGELPDTEGLRRNRRPKCPQIDVLRRGLLELHALRQLAMEHDYEPHASFDEIVTWIAGMRGVTDDA